MRKRLITMLVGLLLATGMLVGCGGSDATEMDASAKTSKEEASDNSGKGNAGTEIRYTRNLDGSISGYTEYEYDSAGNNVKLTNYSSNDNILNLYEYEYDSAGNKIKEIGYFYGDLSYESEYDSAGNIIKQITYDSDGSISHYAEIKYEYDSTGSSSKGIAYNEDGSRENGWVECEYNSAGKLIKITSYEEDGGSNSSQEAEYDSAGNLIKITIHNPNMNSEVEFDSTGKPIKAKSVVNNELGYGGTEYEYDSAGNQTKATKYNADGRFYLGNFEYDNKGNLTIAKVTYCEKDGSIDHWEEYEYDGDGNQINVTKYNAGGSIRD